VSYAVEYYHHRVRSGERIGRAFYCFLPQQRVVILHALVKSTRTTPARDLRIARSRLEKVLHG